MDNLSVRRPTGGRRFASPVGRQQMAAVTDIAENPVAISVVSPEGTHAISAERGKGGKVWLTCGCAASVADGWCRHRLDLLCFRYTATRDLAKASRTAFEQIVTGTSLQAAGLDADRALKAFNACLRAFDTHRPAEIIGDGLTVFTDLVSDLAACAGELEDALGALRRLLERA
jgi:hypothetical protein